MDDFVHEAKRRENAASDTRRSLWRPTKRRRSARAASRSAKASRPAKIEEEIQTLAAQIVELDAKLATAKDYRIALESDR